MCKKPKLQIVLEKVKNASVVLNCEPDGIEKIRKSTAEMASDISLEQEVLLSKLLSDKKHFEDNLDFLPLYKNIVKEGITVYG